MSERPGELADWVTGKWWHQFFKGAKGYQKARLELSDRSISRPGVSRSMNHKRDQGKLTCGDLPRDSQGRGKGKLELYPDARGRLVQWRWCETCCAKGGLIRREGDGYYVKSMQALRRQPITSDLRACEL